MFSESEVTETSAVLDHDPTKYWQDIGTVPLGPYSRVLSQGVTAILNP